ncbi:hypothetical protein BG004_007174 [Podila humilis]|nr:hypothetical protein BG004_007174 [Podila humilis]
MKAKVAAIHMAIKSSPSLCHLCPNSDSSEDDHEFQQRLRPRTKVSNRSHDPKLDSGTAPTREAASNDSDALVKKFGPSLKTLFQDMIEKMWWRPLCEDYHLPSNISPSNAFEQGITIQEDNKLGQFCAFAVGRIVAQLHQEDTADMERYYNIMPSYMRRFALLQHVTELCVLNVPTALLIQPLVTICAHYRADYQGLKLLQHMFTCLDAYFNLNYDWAHSVAQKMECCDSWVEFMSANLHLNHLSNKSFLHFLSEIRPNYRAKLVRAVFDTLMDEGDQVTKRTWRSKLVKWTSQLISDSLDFHQQLPSKEEEEEEKATNSKLSIFDEVIEHIAEKIYASEQTDLAEDTLNTVTVWKTLNDLGMGLALHSLYITMTGSSMMDEGEKVEKWINLLGTHTNSNTSRVHFRVVIESYGLLTNLNALALMLDAVGLYDLSDCMLRAMISDYAALQRRTTDQLGYNGGVTLLTLNRHLEEVIQRKEESVPLEDNWYYDDILEDWVERFLTTDEPRRMSMHIKNGKGSSHNQAPASRTKKVFDLEDMHLDTRQDNVLSDNSLDYQSDATWTPQKPQRRTSFLLSPYAMRSPIHFAMTPIKRRERITRYTASRIADLEDLDQYHNTLQHIEDHGLGSGDSDQIYESEMNESIEEGEQSHYADFEDIGSQEEEQLMTNISNESGTDDPNAESSGGMDASPTDMFRPASSMSLSQVLASSRDILAAPIHLGTELDTHSFKSMNNGSVQGDSDGSATFTSDDLDDADSDSPTGSSERYRHGAAYRSFERSPTPYSSSAATSTPSSPSPVRTRVAQFRIGHTRIIESGTEGTPSSSQRDDPRNFRGASSHIASRSLENSPIRTRRRKHAPVLLSDSDQGANQNTDRHQGFQELSPDEYHSFSAGEVIPKRGAILRQVTKTVPHIELPSVQKRRPRCISDSSPSLTPEVMSSHGKRTESEDSDGAWSSHEQIETISSVTSLEPTLPEESDTNRTESNIQFLDLLTVNTHQANTKQDKKQAKKCDEGSKAN